MNLVIPQLIVGLGNPESKYYKTRHNVGFTVLDQVALSWQFSWQENRRFQGMIAEGFAPNRQKIHLLKPLTYMNLSGQSVRSVLNWHKYSENSLLIVYDDMDLPLGRIRLRLGGSAGGHNGMKSIISHVGTEEFPRLRIGIGKGSREAVSHVLGRFSEEETQIVSKVLMESVKCIETSISQGVEKAMNLYNNKNLIADG
jgi:PTH1 family peptidyl-tRNA hydrolase